MTAARHLRAVRATEGRSAIVRGARAAGRRVRSTPRPLALILAAAAVLAVAWALVMPPFQGPDESEHFAYVQHLAETGSAPSSVDYGGAGSHSSEQTFALDRLGLRMLMSSRDARPLFDAVDQADWQAFEDRATTRQRADGEGLNPIAKNPPLYYAYESAAYLASPGDGLYDKLLVTRLANALLFLVTIVCAWLAAAELTRRLWARTLTAAIVALQPQLTSTAGIVNADTLLVTSWSAFTALALRTLVRGPTAGRVLGLSLLAAASALTHGRGLALLPALVLVLAIAFWHSRPPVRAALRWSGVAALVLAAGLVAFRVFSTSGGGTGGTLYGGQANYINQGGFGPWGFVSHVWQFYLPKLPFLSDPIGPDYGFRQMYVETFFGAFGGLEIRFPERVYTVLRLGVLLGLAALVVAAIARRVELRPLRHVVLGLAAICLSLIALLHLVSYLALLGSGDPLIVGRYLLPLVVPFALAIVFVATSLPRRLGVIGGGLLIAVGLLLQLSALGMTAERFYA
jgi:4-amino-4-deoxy-L-arabinose transferase-like glycosyltransferase